MKLAAAIIAACLFATIAVLRPEGSVLAVAMIAVVAAVVFLVLAVGRTLNWLAHLFPRT